MRALKKLILAAIALILWSVIVVIALLLFYAFYVPWATSVGVAVPDWVDPWILVPGMLFLVWGAWR